MFGTLRYDVSTNAALSNNRRVHNTIQLQPAQATAGLFPPHAACDTCRAKKLKCSGHKPACHRCEATNLRCQYIQAVDKRKRKTSSRPTGAAAAHSRRRSMVSGGKAVSNEDHESNDSQVQGSKSPAVTIDDPVMDIWDPTSCSGVFAGHMHQNTPVAKNFPSAADDLTSNMCHTDQGSTHRGAASVNLWDALGSPDLDLGNWDDAAWLSPGSTGNQGHGHGIEQQRMSVTQTRSAGSVSSPAFSTIFPNHEAVMGVSTGKAGRESISIDPSIPPSNPYLSPASTVRLDSRNNIADSSKAHHQPPKTDLNASKNDVTNSQCSCLQSLAILLDDISTRIFEGSAAIPFDISLGFLKSTLSKCSAALKCTRCLCRSEFCMFLSLVVERLVALSEDVALEHALSTPDHPPGKDSTTPDQPTASSRRFGTYDLSSMEHGFIARGLLTLHFQSCRVLVGKLTNVARLANRGAHVHVLGAAEQQIEHLMAVLAEQDST
ncbi:hypothetical protein CC86DRAFT_58477 [Ophiobolus disseminans]|uniref:Zn(2)-C6 fungal-type domain-containing protein n=1 Tax=Ophiobolus disseminans TaxID=1469910 RepID=A0A6A6ZRE2_9PLEO|nr:hypothetical protein CC86DRAFT_58477 [Ophiobolus disseminans]